jgi:RNA polymerase sigma factor (sigma-70 family)
VRQIRAVPDIYGAMTASSPQARAERFERCFERNYGDVARYCARRTASPEDAEDAATDVFATAWRRLGDMPPEPDDRLWLFGIARLVLANVNRAERRRARLAFRLSADPPPAPVPPASAGSEAATIARALAAVLARDRELLLLAGWEGLAPADIARVLGRPAPLVSQRLSRARRRFAAALAAAGHEGEGRSPRSVPVT